MPDQVKIQKAQCDGTDMEAGSEKSARLSKAAIDALPSGKNHRIDLTISYHMDL